MLAALTIAAAIALTPSIDAGEGMWMPHQLRDLSSELKQQGYQVKATQLARLDSAPLAAIVQVAAGCTGVFVSPDGLIATNHHCAQSVLQYNSTPQRDLLEDGFVARSRSEELWNGPMSRVYITTDMRDVTERLVGGIPAKISDRERYDFIDQREKKLVAECERSGGVRCMVGSFYGGVSYWLIAQKEVRDVRLVYAPPISIGNFGGDTDNWVWPRHSGDFTFYRAYVGPNGEAADHSPANVPMRTPEYVKISTAGFSEGDPTMVVGYPARTNRFKTFAELERARTVDFPRSIRIIRGALEALRKAGEDDEDIRLKNAPLVFTYENSLKYMQGVLDSLASSDLMAEKQERDGEVCESFGGTGPLAKMLELQKRSWKTSERDSAFYWLVKGSRLLNQAALIYRYALERPKKDAERQWGYQDRDVPKLREAIARIQRVYSEKTERMLLRYFLLEAARLPEDQRIAAVDKALAETGREGVEEQVNAVVDAIFASTRMDKLEAREEMFRSSAESLRKRRDPLMDLAIGLMPIMIENEEREEEIFAAMSIVRPEYMKKLLALMDGDKYSDANWTLRVSFGEVAGYEPGDGVRYAAITTAPGILRKMRRGGPYQKHEALARAIEEEQFGRYADPDLGTLPVNFITTNDITGGSSGSPVLNTRGEMIGMAFDGNIEAMASDFAYNPEVNRSINIDVRYMLWVMDAVDGAGHLLREMGLRPQFASGVTPLPERDEAATPLPATAPKTP